MTVITWDSDIIIHMSLARGEKKLYRKAGARQDRAAMAEDRLLMEAVKEGDNGAYDRLMRRHHKVAYLYAARFLNDRDLAQDVVQEAFFRVYRHARRFREGGNFRDWLLSIVHNECLRSYGARKKRFLLKLGFKTRPVRQPATPETSLQQKELTTCLGKALAALTQEMRTAVIDRDILNLTFDEMAAQRGENRRTLRSRVSRGRKAIKAQVQKKLGLDFGKLLAEEKIRVPFEGVWRDDEQE